MDDDGLIMTDLERTELEADFQALISRGWTKDPEDD